MKRLLAAVMVLVVPILISTGGWALTVDDRQGVAGAYYGGIYNSNPIGGPHTTNPSYAYDTIPQSGPSADTWNVTGFTATNIAGGYIQVTFSGPYFSTNSAANPTGGTAGRPGDLYISSTGWVVATDPISSGGHGIGDTFSLAEGWNYVIPLLGTPVATRNN